jgi:hypothetical protein
VSTARVVTMVTEDDELRAWRQVIGNRTDDPIEAPERSAVLRALGAMSMRGQVTARQGHNREQCALSSRGAQRCQHVLRRFS